MPEICRLLAAVHLPQAVSIVHVPGHQKGENAWAQGNRAADAAALEAAAGDHKAHVLTVGLPPPGMGTLPPSPIYSPSDLRWVQDNTTRPVSENRWYWDQDDNLLLPADLGKHLCTHLHQTTHLGEKKTLTLLQTAQLQFPQQKKTTQDIVLTCKALQITRPRKAQHAGLRYRGKRPGHHWEIISLR